MNAESIRRILKGREGWAVGAAFLLILVFFWPTIASFPETWSRWRMSHGWLIVGIVGWVVWRDRGVFLSGKRVDSIVLLPIAALSLLWLGSVVTHIQLGHQAFFLLLVTAWGLAVLNRDEVPTVLILGASLLLVLPVWEWLYPVLRTMTTVVSGTLVRLSGIRSVIDGDMIHIEAGSFIVDDGCAGLSFFRAGVVIAVTYSLLLVRSWRAQVGIVALGGLIAIFGNWIRVAALIVVGHFTQMQSSLMDDHIAFGWVIFTIGLLPFFMLARRIELSRFWSAVGSRKTTHQHDAEAETADARGAAPPELALVRRGALASALAVIGPVVYFTFGAFPPSHAERTGLSDLGAGDGWLAPGYTEGEVLGWSPGFQGAQEEEATYFTDGDRSLWGYRYVYHAQRQGAKLIGYPNRIAASSDLVDQQVIGPIDAAGRRWVRQAIVRTDEMPVLVWYWYRVGGIETFSEIQAKALEIPAFLRRDRTAELLAVAAPCEPEGCGPAFDALADYMGAPIRRSVAPQGEETADPADEGS